MMGEPWTVKRPSVTKRKAHWAWSPSARQVCDHLAVHKLDTQERVDRCIHFIVM